MSALDKNSYSLLARINKLILIPISIGLLVIGIFTFKIAYHEAEEVYDAGLARSAGILLSIVKHEVEEHGTTVLEVDTSIIKTDDEYEKKLAFRVWNENQIIAQSPNMSSFPLQLPPPMFSNITTDDTLWRVYLLEAKNSSIKIEVAEQFEIRNELIEDILTTIFTPLILIIPLIAIAVWIGLSTGLSPVKSLSVEVEGRSAETLERLHTTNIPKEIKPLTTSIDHLMKRMKDTIENERQFTDNAAHELRTPLAAIKTLAQVAKQHSREDISDEKLTEILDDLVSGTDRATHLVEQLLDFARLNHSNLEIEKVNLTSLTNKSIEDYKKVANEKNITLTFHRSEDIEINGHIDTLPILMRNLLDNACKYTPNGGKVDIKVTKKDNKVVLEVTDTGIGIPDSEKEKVFERFYRVPGENKATGCGLGLAIIKWIADHHNASLLIKDNPSGQGTSFILTFKNNTLD